MSIARVDGSRGARHGGFGEGPRAAAPPPPRLLPPLGLQGLLHAAQLSNRKTQETASLAELERAQSARQAHFESAREAQRRAEEAAAKASSEQSKANFWKTVGVVASALGAAASIVATGGASAPAVIALAGVMLSASSPYIGKGVEGVTGDTELGEKFAMGAALTGAALSIVGGGASLFTSAASTGGQTFASTSAAVFDAASSGAQIGNGIYTIRAKDAESDHEHARADVLQRKTAARREQREIEAVLEELRALESSMRRAFDAVAGVGREVESARQFLNHNLARSLSG